PMFSSDKKIMVVFNGEIFNFVDLRNELSKKYKFKSKSDTEVLIYGYKEWGFESLLKKLNGFFGFCIYDVDKNKIFIGRDRMGIKPVYYNWNDKQKKFVFSSEIKSLLEIPNFKRKINEESLIKYLSLRYIGGDETIFQGINKLLPGHFIEFDNNNKSFILKQYWDITSFKLDEKSGKDDFAKGVDEILNDSIKKRLVADVPVGLFLSGGLDSSVILSYIDKYHKNIHTYSLGFERDDVGDELSAARQTSKYFKTKHKEINLKTIGLNKLPEMIYHLDEPMDDPASLANYFLFEAAKKDGVKVILSGDGADELFGGYSQYKFYMIARKLAILPNPVLKFKAFMFKIVPKKALNAVYPYAQATGEKMNERFYKLLLDVKKRPEEGFLEIVSIFDYDERNELLGPSLKKKNFRLGPLLKSYFKSKDDVINVSNYDLQNYLSEDLLMKPDRMGMAHSIEARVPFLDHRLVEYSRKIPQKYKIKNFSKGKYIMKEAAKNVIPKFVLEKKKQTFQLPLHQWISSDIKESCYKEIMELCEKLDLNKNYVKKIFRDLDKSKLFYGRQIWNLLVLAIWYKIFIDEIPYQNIKLIK
ncbi:MAG: asparagine synthase (glutamine-hydrolyzing), partial [Nanoarchaeota archaeon]|nr:asparagine synthase (glutamine-hydrolyzing) [Nanoarchaeota archaeon]